MLPSITVGTPPTRVLAAEASVSTPPSTVPAPLQADDQAIIIDYENDVLCVHTAVARSFGALLWQVYEGSEPPPNSLTRGALGMSPKGTITGITVNASRHAQLVQTTESVLAERTDRRCGTCQEPTEREQQTVALRNTDLELFWHRECLRDFVEAYQKTLTHL